MIFATSFLLGMTTAALRSAAAIVFVAILIAIAFFAAMIVGPGDVSYFELGISVLGYNAGIMALLTAALLVRAKPDRASGKG